MATTDSGEVTPPPLVSSHTAERLSEDLVPNWLSKSRRSNSKTVRKSGRGTTATGTKRRTASSRTRRLHASSSVRRVTDTASVAAASTVSQLDSAFTKGLVNKTWKVHQISPMYKFSIKPSSLRAYSRHLTACVEAASTNQPVDVTESADLATISPLKLTAPDGTTSLHGIQVELLQHVQRGPAHVVLTAVLCSTVNQSADITLGGPDSELTSMPLMLVRGPVRLRDVLFTWWQSQFDCCVSPVHFSPLELSWMVAMYAGYVPDSGAKNVEMVYKMPDEITKLSNITCNINSADCQRLWLSIHSSDNDLFTSDEVVSFVHAIEEHYYQHFKIKFAALQLSKVGTSVLFVSNDGGLKVYSKQHVHQILSHLIDVIQEDADQ